MNYIAPLLIALALPGAQANRFTFLLDRARCTAKGVVTQINAALSVSLVTRFETRLRRPLTPAEREALQEFQRYGNWNPQMWEQWLLDIPDDISIAEYFRRERHVRQLLIPRNSHYDNAPASLWERGNLALNRWEDLRARGWHLVPGNDTLFASQYEVRFDEREIVVSRALGMLPTELLLAEAVEVAHLFRQIEMIPNGHEAIDRWAHRLDFVAVDAQRVLDFLAFREARADSLVAHAFWRTAHEGIPLAQIRPPDHYFVMASQWGARISGDDSVFLSEMKATRIRDLMILDAATRTPDRRIIPAPSGRESAGLYRAQSDENLTAHFLSDAIPNVLRLYDGSEPGTDAFVDRVVSQVTQHDVAALAHFVRNPEIWRDLAASDIAIRSVTPSRPLDQLLSVALRVLHVKASNGWDVGLTTLLTQVAESLPADADPALVQTLTDLCPDRNFFVLLARLRHESLRMRWSQSSANFQRFIALVDRFDAPPADPAVRIVVDRFVDVFFRIAEAQLRTSQDWGRLHQLLDEAGDTTHAQPQYVVLLAFLSRNFHRFFHDHTAVRTRVQNARVNLELLVRESRRLAVANQ